MLHRAYQGQGNTRLLAVLALAGAVAGTAACGPGQQPDREAGETAGEQTERPTEAGGSDEEAVVDPDLALSPDGGPPGSEVRIEAVGLPPNRRIRLGAGPADSEYEIISETRSDAQGRVDATVSVPSWAEPGDRFVFVAETPDGTTVLSDPFAVTAPDGASGARPPSGAYLR